MRIEVAACEHRVARKQQEPPPRCFGNELDVRYAIAAVCEVGTVEGMRKAVVTGGRDKDRHRICGTGAELEAALETGMRLGEILSLQWTQVEGLKFTGSAVRWEPNAELVLPFGKTKTRRDRRIPISTRLKAILEMRRFDPAGEPIPPHGYVFGNAIGGRVQDNSRAWHSAVLKSHGHQPTYTKTKQLSETSREALRAINLHFHDLRREAGSRWLEGGVPLHTVRDWLGHTNIAQTSTYLSGTMKTQHDAMRQFEERRAAALQPIATNVGTGGPERSQPDISRHNEARKNTDEHEPHIM